MYRTKYVFKKLWIEYDSDIFTPTEIQKLYLIYLKKKKINLLKFTLSKTMIQVMSTNTIKFYYIYVWDVH